MKIETPQQAHDAMADVIWWLKGFRASCDSEAPARIELDRMIDGLRSAQDFVMKEDK